MLRNCAAENLEIPGLVLADHPGMTSGSIDKTPPYPLKAAVLAGRFRPAKRFATRGPSLQALGLDLSAPAIPVHRRARFLKPE
jgi:hypothetical protein